MRSSSGRPCSAGAWSTASSASRRANCMSAMTPAILKRRRKTSWPPGPEQAYVGLLQRGFRSRVLAASTPSGAAASASFPPTARASFASKRDRETKSRQRRRRQRLAPVGWSPARRRGQYRRAPRAREPVPNAANRSNFVTAERYYVQFGGVVLSILRDAAQTFLMVDPWDGPPREWLRNIAR